MAIDPNIVTWTSPLPNGTRTSGSSAARSRRGRWTTPAMLPSGARVSDPGGVSSTYRSVISPRYVSAANYLPNNTFVNPDSVTVRRPSTSKATTWSTDWRNLNTPTWTDSGLNAAFGAAQRANVRRQERERLAAQEVLRRRKLEDEERKREAKVRAYYADPIKNRDALAGQYTPKPPPRLLVSGAQAGNAQAQRELEAWYARERAYAAAGGLDTTVTGRARYIDTPSGPKYAGQRPDDVTTTRTLPSGMREAVRIVQPSATREAPGSSRSIHSEEQRDTQKRVTEVNNIISDYLKNATPQERKDYYEAQRQQAPKRVGDTDYRPRSEQMLYQVDTLLDRNRFSKYAQLLDTNALAGKFSHDEMARMIQMGLVTYGKNARGYRQAAFSGNIAAIQRFLNDNYTTDKQGALKRKGSKLQFSDQMIEALSGSVEAWNLGKQWINPRSGATDLGDIPTKANQLGDKVPDHQTMATQYIKDQYSYNTLAGKIEQKIRDEGGGALLDKMLTSKNITTAQIQALKPYMYSFSSGPYAKMQERWIDETFTGNTPGAYTDAAARARDYANLAKYAEANAKERERLAKAEQKAAEKLAVDQFDNAPKEYWMNNLIGMVDTGTAMQIPRYVLNDMFFSDLATGTLKKDINPDDLARLYTSVSDALQAGAPVDPFLVTLMGKYQDQISQGSLTSARAAKEPQSGWETVASSLLFNPALAAVAGSMTYGWDKLQGKDVSWSQNVKNAKYDWLSKGGRIAQTLGDTSGPLSPENTDSIFSAAFLDNAIKSPIRMALGLPMGLYQTLVDPYGTGKAILQDYGKRYGALWGDPDSNFIESSLQDPWAPALDILGLVPAIGAAAKATSLARIASVTSKISKADRAALGAQKIVVPFRGEMSLDAALDLGRTYGPARTVALRELAQREAALTAGKPGRYVSAYRFAKLQRMALTGDVAAQARLAELAPKGYGGLNSAYTPHLMDKVAAWFEPRYKVMKLEEGLPDHPEREAIIKLGDEIKSKLSPENAAVFDAEEAVAMRRLAGSPLARGAQEAMYLFQRGISKRRGGKDNPIMELLVNMPLTGFNFRFSRALKENPYGALDLLQRELFQQALHERLINAGDLSDAEHLAIMSFASGHMYDMGKLASIARLRVERMRTAGALESDAIFQLTEKELARLTDDSFRSEVAKTVDMINDPESERGAILRKIIDKERQRSERLTHEMGVEVDALSTRQLVLRYQNLLNALDITPQGIIDDLERIMPGSSDKIARLGPWWHMAETGGFRDALKAITDEKGNTIEWRSIKKDLERAGLGDQYAPLIRRIEESVQALAKYTDFRDMDKNPLVVISGAPTEIAGRRFIPVRHIRIDGEYTDMFDEVRRKPMLSDQELLLPEEFFHKAKAADGTTFIRTLSKKSGSAFEHGIDPLMSEVEEQLTRASVNFGVKTFPDARDFVDKISDKLHTGGYESFAQKQNRNSIASSGLMSYRLEVQWAAHKNALHRRFKRDIQTTLERNATFVTREQFDAMKGDFAPLRTMRVFDTREQAIKYANDYQSHGAQSINDLIEIQVNGQTKFVTRMNHLDTNAATLKELAEQRFLSAEEWQKAMLDEIDAIDINNSDGLLAVVPKKVINDLTESYKRSENIAAKALRGYSKVFKLMALSMNPRFVTQQVFGAMVMMMMANPMQAGHILARFTEYAIKKRRYATGKWKLEDISPYDNHGDDYDIIMNYFIRDFEDNIYGHDAFDAANKKGFPAKAVKAMSSGYVIAMAAEKNMRVAIVREAAMHYPGFKDFMESPEVIARAKQGIPSMGYDTVTPFHAAMDLLADPKSPHYDANFLREMRHTADMISGNYRDFSEFENTIRNYFLPFYAWTRHSALFTKRMVQERPLTVNTLYNIGNYGYEKIAENGGLPEWLLQTVPMPDVIAKVIGLDPNKDNRLGFGSINPFATTAQNIEAMAGLFRGDPFSYGGGVMNMSNPFFETLAEQSMGVSLATGAPINDDKRGIVALFGGMFTKLPPSRILMGLWKSSADLNELRGKQNPDDIFKDPRDPSKGLSIPDPNLNTSFPTSTRAGLFNVVAPMPAYSVNPDMLGEAVSREYKARGVLYNEYEQDRNKGLLRTATALNKWKYKRDFIYNIWLPKFGKDNPEIASMVLQQLEKEKPTLPKGFPEESAMAILTGGIRTH